MSRKYSIDANHQEIKKHLESLDVQVIDFTKAGDGFPDLMVVNRYSQQVILIEIKVGKDAKIKKSQMKFIGSYLGFVAFAETVEEAEKVAQEPFSSSLSQQTKERIAEFEKTFQQKEMRFSSFKKEIGL